jgi:formylmethanofuran dehydrogenase subunit E
LYTYKVDKGYQQRKEFKMNSFNEGTEVWCDSCTEPVVTVYGEESQYESVCPKCNTGFYLETL